MKKVKAKVKVTSKKRAPKKTVKRKLQIGRVGRGTIFVVVILVTLIFGGYLFVGGTIPEKIPKTRTEGIVSIEKPSAFPQENSLQLHFFRGVTITPYPTQAPAVPEPESLEITEVACGHGLQGIAKPDLIYAYRIATTPASGNQQSLQIFYAGLDALPVGTQAQTQFPTQHLIRPPVNANNKDANGYPVSPAVFITDITANAADISGDAQSGGIAQFPSDVYGAWRTETGRSGTVPNGQNLGVGADLWPAANGPGGGARRTDWSAQLIWKIADMKTKTGAALIQGNTYRMQIVLHEGTNNQEVAELCISAKLGATSQPLTQGTLQASFLFDFDNATLKPQVKLQLDTQVRLLNQPGNTTKQITVQGHTDPVGDTAYNLNLSQQRADAVKNYLVSQGVAASRIKVESKGETIPKADAASSRRVELYY